MDVVNAFTFVYRNSYSLCCALKGCKISVYVAITNDVTVVFANEGDVFDNFNVGFCSPLSCLVTILIAQSNIIVVGDVASVDVIAFVCGIILFFCQ